MAVTVGHDFGFVFVPEAVDQNGNTQRLLVGSGGVKPIHDEQPPQPVKPSFQTISGCGGGGGDGGAIVAVASESAGSGWAAGSDR